MVAKGAKLPPPSNPYVPPARDSSCARHGELYAFDNYSEKTKLRLLASFREEEVLRLYYPPIRLTSPIRLIYPIKFIAVSKKE